jgi:phage terminase large subunit GpA-like protein
MSEADKFDANARGRFVNGRHQSIDQDGNITGTIPPNSTASYWVPGLVSMFAGGTIAKRAKKLLEARHAAFADQEAKEKAVLNVQFGELWAPRGKGSKAEDVSKLLVKYPRGHVPKDAAALTMGIDVSGDRLWYVIRAWGHQTDMTSWLIEAGEIYGSVSPKAKNEAGMLPVFQRLNDKLMQLYDGLYISACAIDSGFETDIIYDFCQYHDESGVSFPVKGDDVVKNYVMQPSPIGHRGDGRPARDILLWRLNTDALKQQVHKSYVLPSETYGSFNINENAFDDGQKRKNYLAHMVSESRVLDKKTNRHYWRRNGYNHWFDAEVYARAAALKLGVETWEPAVRIVPKIEKPTTGRTSGGWVNAGGGWL